MPLIPTIRRAAFLLALLALGVLTFPGCELADDGSARVWTDDADLAIAAELFNASQDEFRIEVEYKSNLVEALLAAETPPDIVAGAWLACKESRAIFQSLDYLSSDLLINQGKFYPELLALGAFGGRQLLLPLSFNLPAVVFKKGLALEGGDSSIIVLDEIKRLGLAYNKKRGTAYTRMGFSPRWFPDAPYTVAALFGAGFREAAPLAWDQGKLDAALSYLDDWVEANGGVAAEDDFQYKYLYDPEYRLVADGRILFGYAASSRIFSLPADKRLSLDFRWITKDDRLVPLEEARYVGVVRNGRGFRAEEAFLAWLFSLAGQRAILEAKQSQRSLDYSFGIAGGFSAVREVVETVFPSFYPELVGHLPPMGYMTAREALPRGWESLKRNVVKQWIDAALRAGPGDWVDSLSRLVEEWLKRNS